MKKYLLAALTALLLLAGCAAPKSAGEEDALHIYLPTDPTLARGGDAIEAVPIQLSDSDRYDQAVSVVEQVLAGDEDHASPLPAGTKLRSCRMVGGIVYLDFSGEYSRLSGMELTVADYCLALSLTELPDIYGVKITVLGQELDYRKGGVLLAGNVLLTSTEDVVRELAATLYFPDESGKLVREERLLMLYEGQSRAGVVMEALLSGPESEGLVPLVPEGFATPSVRTDEGVCYVNISGESAALLPRDTVDTVLDAMRRSLRSVEGIGTVQFLLDGEVTELFE